MLWNWGHSRFHFVPLPIAAAWLNLIEGFSKILGQRALAGRSCTNHGRGRPRPARRRGGLESAPHTLLLGTTTSAQAPTQA